MIAFRFPGVLVVYFFFLRKTVLNPHPFSGDKRRPQGAYGIRLLGHGNLDVESRAQGSDHPMVARDTS